MKLILELDLDRNLLFNSDSTKEQQINAIQRKFVEQLNDLIMNAQLDNSKFHNCSPKHPFYGMGSLKLIDFEQ